MATLSEENNSDQPENEKNMWGFFHFFFSILLVMAAAIMVTLSSIYQSYAFFYEYDVYGALPTVCNVLAGIVIVNTVVGILSMFKRSIRILIVNGFISCVVFFIILAVLCLALTMDSDAFLASLNIPVQAIEDPEISAQVNFIQRTLGCCGSNDYRDYLGVQLPANMSHTIVSKPDESSGNMVAIILPATCCVDPEQQFCTRMWSIGCKTALVESIVRNFNILSNIGWGMLVLDLLTIIFAVFVFRAFRKEKNEKYLNKQMNIVLDAEDIHKKKTRQPQ